MNWLTRSEEIVLLCVWKLQKEAYGLAIRAMISELTGRSWSIGALYAPLHRLEKKRLVTAKKGRPRPERGGRSRTYYELTRDGKRSLLEIRGVLDNAWKNIPELVLEESG